MLIDEADAYLLPDVFNTPPVEGCTENADTDAPVEHRELASNTAQKLGEDPSEEGCTENADTDSPVEHRELVDRISVIFVHAHMVTT